MRRRKDMFKIQVQKWWSCQCGTRWYHASTKRQFLMLWKYWSITGERGRVDEQNMVITNQESTRANDSKGCGKWKIVNNLIPWVVQGAFTCQCYWIGKHLFVHYLFIHLNQSVNIVFFIFLWLLCCLIGWILLWYLFVILFWDGSMRVFWYCSV